MNDRIENINQNLGCKLSSIESQIQALIVLNDNDNSKHKATHRKKSKAPNNITIEIDNDL